MVSDIDFKSIRPYGTPASRMGAFEELVSVIIQQRDDWPSGTCFSRFGNPDGGREGKGTLPDGTVWAWQAKYLFTLDASALKQIGNSLIRTLTTEPNLTRYFVALPIDLPAGDNDRSMSAYEKWINHVKLWQDQAAIEQREVDVVFVGAHDLTTALTKSENAGRVRYWFNKDLLSAQRQKQHIEEVAARLGRRYSPKLNIDTETIQAIEAVGRTPSYAAQWRHELAELRSVRQRYWQTPDTHSITSYQKALAKCDEALDAAEIALRKVANSVTSFDKLASANDEIDAGIHWLTDVDKLLREDLGSDVRYRDGAAVALFRNVQDALDALYSARELGKSTCTHAAKYGELLITGRAGVGKTHLLCDVARRRIEEGKPTIMLLGQSFDRRELLSQVPNIGEFEGTLAEMLAALDAAGEAAGSRSLLIIDAINESEHPDRWSQEIEVLRRKVSRLAHLSLVISCRSEFLDPVVGNSDICSYEHRGFEESTELAVLRFAAEYQLPVPTFPILNPEFGNPLFLRLACEALKSLGPSRFSFDSAGLLTVCEAFIDATNQRLAGPARCDYDSKQNLVSKVIQELVSLGVRTFDRTVVGRIAERILPNRKWSNSLLKGLIDEGVLIELNDKQVGFGYQRLGDVARAASLADKPLDDIVAWYQKLGKARWAESGTLSALAVMLPETHGEELLDLIASADKCVRSDIIDGFIDSLTFRSSKAVTPRTVAITEWLLASDRHRNDIWTQLVRLACVPDHPLNARWLYNYLASQTLADRDTTWSVWLLGALDQNSEQSSVRTLVDWAWPLSSDEWPISRRGTAILDREVAVLAMITLGCLLTTSDRTVRDRATKALVSLAEKHVSAFAEALELLLSVNDPYVIERVSAAACGVVLRNAATEDISVIANVLDNFVSEEWPRHLLTRDYIRRVFTAARSVGWNGTDGAPPYGSQWPIEASSDETISHMVAAPDYAYGSVWHSLTGMGDFGRYIVGPAIRMFQVQDSKVTRNLVDRAIFDRVCDLGWTPEKFGSIDRRISRYHFDDNIERIGKKYQWIAFYEVLGTLADNFRISSDWSDEGPNDYSCPEEIVWRDLDVTLLVRRPANDTPSGVLWYSPASASFSIDNVVHFPDSMEGVPDPLDLLTVEDPDGEPWLALMSFPTWSERQSEEIEILLPAKRRIWMRIQAYLVSTKSVNHLKSQVKKNSWSERCFPDTPECVNLLLGDHPGGYRWDGAAGYIEEDEWECRSDGVRRREFGYCGSWYMGTGTHRDASTSTENCGLVPSRMLFDLLELKHGVDFVWKDDVGLSVLDPAVFGGGPNTLLLRRSCFRTIRDAGFSMFWTVRAGCDLVAAGYGEHDDSYRWVEGGAFYILVNDGIEKIRSRAARYAPGPTRESEVEWPTRDAG